MESSETGSVQEAGRTLGVSPELYLIFFTMHKHIVPFFFFFKKALRSFNIITTIINVWRTTIRELKLLLGE